MAVRTTYNPAEAHVLAARLQSEGIGAWVHQEPSGSAFGITVGLLGELKVLVAERDYDAALALLEQDPPKLAQDADQVIFGDEDDRDEPDEDA
jgi:hypothetical protein